jgi:hypothetical protein
MSWKKRVNSVSMSVMTVMEGALSVV